LNLALVYLLLLKATLSAFSGLAALPVLREEFVVQRHLLTDRQLNTALVVGRTTPGPKGLYIVSVGYYAAGFPGAVMAWLALLTPAFLVIPLLHFAGRFAENPGLKRALRAVVLASAGVSLSATLPLAADALRGPVTWGIAAVSLLVLLRTKVETVWVVLAAAMVALLFSFASGLR
jgi:chromate transporter